MKENKNIKGVKIQTFNTRVIILCGFLFVILIYATALLPSRYNALIKDTDQYINFQKDAQMVNDASDYLTEQVRMYVESENIRYMENYFEEVNETKRREKALEELKKCSTDENAKDSLEAAVRSSKDLMKQEIYAMKLVLVADGYDDMESLPEKIRETQLTTSDAVLKPEEMKEKARKIVFSEEYENSKEQIYSYLSGYVDNITGRIKIQQEKSVKSLGDILVFQRIFIILLFTVSILTFVVITKLIVKPLSMHIRNIRENIPLEVTGSYECKYLALTYNEIYEQNAAREQMLLQKAEYDSLTGLLNRGAFEEIKKLLKENPFPIALAVIDIDKFKDVNDQNGHETGNEFVVIITNIKSENQQAIRRKFVNINKILKKSEDIIPQVSISVGIAFSLNGYTDDLFGKADTMLYEAKNNGRSGCRIYGER